MKKLLTYAAMYIVYISAANAQEADESRNFLYFYSDSVLYARYIDLERNFFGSPYFMADSKRVHPEQVRFFNNERGFFANVKDLNIAGRTAFSERIRKGRINLYEETTISWEPGYGYGRRYYARPEAYGVNNYYNIGYGPLKKANYVNLSVDLADNPVSMDLLKKYRSVKTASIGLYVAAGASLVASFVSFLSMPDIKHSDNGFGFEHGHDSGATGGFILLGLGAGLATSGYLISLKAPRYLKDAIDSYNYR